MKLDLKDRDAAIFVLSAVIWLLLVAVFNTAPLIDELFIIAECYAILSFVCVYLTYKY